MSNRERTPVPRFRPLDAAGLLARGLAMGAADIIPGVSGGTIALVTGIYERFIGALGSLSPAFMVPLLRGRVGEAVRELRRLHLAVLIPLFVGILTAVVLMSRLITGLLHDRPGAMYAFFFGLILASAWAPFSRMKRRSAVHGVAALIAAFAAWGIVGLQPSGLDVVASPSASPSATTWFYPGKIRSADDLRHLLAAAPSPELVVFDPKGLLAESALPGGVTRLADEAALADWAENVEHVGLLETPRAPLWWIFCCGAISISAMILPGLSGSFLMLLLGQYHAVLSTIGRMVDHAKGFLGADPDALVRLSGRTFLDDAVFLGVFGCGVVLGLGVFSRVVALLFRRAHDVTMAALTGLMIGALRLPGEQVLANSGVGRESWGMVVTALLVGAALVTALTIYDARARRDAAVAG